MKLIRRDIDKDTSGTLVLTPDDAEDMWYIYNLVQTGDEIEAITYRKLVSQASDGSSSKKATPRVRLRLRIVVEKIEFDTEGQVLRLNGPTVGDHKDVPQGSYHTMKLEPGLPFTLYKDEWDSYALMTVEEATNIENRSDIAAVVLQPGLAHVCLVTEAMTVNRGRIEVVIPRKRRGDNAAQDKAMERFFKQVYDTIVQQINLDKIKVVLLAGPGTIGTELLNFVFRQATVDNNSELVKSRAKFLVGHASSGHMIALAEALQDPQLTTQLATTRYGREIAVLDRFFKSLNDDDGRAWYGPNEVARAIRRGNVETLLVTDTLFRSSDIAERKRYAAMVEDVRDLGREVLILSSLHSSGEQLDSISGVACMLLYPDPDLDAESSESSPEN